MTGNRSSDDNNTDIQMEMVDYWSVSVAKTMPHHHKVMFFSVSLACTMDPTSDTSTLQISRFKMYFIHYCREIEL